MAVFKCKMCAGLLNITENTRGICTCDYCGTTQTIPSINDESIQNLFNRANVLRMKAEFDKAEEIYEKIILSCENEPEAYWGLMLCRYGVEYVEDPKSHERIPTCHRASYESIISDDDYKLALKNASDEERIIYEKEAKIIDGIQKGIISLAQNEKPYDVFICYKETDENGKRTPDSVIANDIYYQLSKEGYKVFYAAITLESKIGQEYEPYIFSALNSAKVMLVIGTKPEYFNSVWVKNEWFRYLKKIKNDSGKLLIPCYKDMDAYELPEEFAHLQAQDMSKIGFINDLVRGIAKVINKETKNSEEKVSSINSQSNTNALIKRGYISLEDEEWDKADSFFEDVLNLDAECSEAYIGKLLVKLRLKDLESLKEHYINKYDGAKHIEKDICKEVQQSRNKAISMYVVDGYLDVNDIMKEYSINTNVYLYSEARKNQKNEILKTLSNEKLLNRARQYAKGEQKEKLENFITSIVSFYDSKINEAIESDSNKMNSSREKILVALEEAEKRVKDLYDNAIRSKNKADEAQKKKIKIITKVSAMLAALCVLIFLIVLLFKFVIIPNNEYKKAIKMASNGNYYDAMVILNNLGDYKNSHEYVSEYEILHLNNNLKVNDKIIFGDFNGENEWIVIAKEDDKILVVSKNSIYKMAYDEYSTSSRWKNSSIREWLNGYYYNEAFSDKEKQLIITTYYDNEDKDLFSTDDDIFILSKDQFSEYIQTANKEVRVALIKEEKHYNYSRWWLRDRGEDRSISYVDEKGVIRQAASNGITELGVRPAMWLKISE